MVKKENVTMKEKEILDMETIIKKDYVIKKIYTKPKTRKPYKRRDDGHNKYIPNGKGVYCKVDIDKNLYIGSTSTSFKERYANHTNKENRWTSAQIVANEHRFGVLLDMSEEDDTEVIKLVENEFINLFKDDADFNLVNKVSAKVSKNTSSSKCTKTVKLTNPEKYHDLVLEILNDEVTDTLETIECRKEADVNKINEYLQSIIGKKLTKDKQNELANVIGITDAYGRQQKSFSIMKNYIDDNTDYILDKKRIVKQGNKITIWIINQKTEVDTIC